MTHSNPRRNMIPQAVLMRSGIKVVNTAKPKDAHNVVKRNRFNAIKASSVGSDAIWTEWLRGGKSAAKKKKNPEKSAAKAERPRR
ncbi:hypothetical protein Tco_0522875 [Tanacetum coccineum]